MSNPVLVHTAKSIIERDALLAHLNENMIKAGSPSRDMSRKYTENTVDLSLGGYSVFFDGFKIFVKQEQRKIAEEAIQDFLKKTNENVEKEEPKKISYLNKFYFFGIAAVFIPVVPIFFGIYFLNKGLKNKEKIKKSYFFISILFYVGSLFSIYVVYDFVISFF